MLLVSSISLIRSGEVDSLQQAFAGCLLANLMLLPGLSVLYAAYRRKPLVHDCDTTRISIKLLHLAVSGFVLPTVFDMGTGLSDVPTAALSRACSILFILGYASFLVFQFDSHKDVFQILLPPHGAGSMNTVTGSAAVTPNPCRRAPEDSNGLPWTETDPTEYTPTEARRDASGSAICVWTTLLVIFAGSTVLIYFIVDNIVANVQALQIPGIEFFSGLVLFPVLNCDWAAMEQADRSMDMMLTFTLGKSVQTALFIAPIMVIVGWGLGDDALTLSFDLSIVVSLFLSIFLITRIAAAPSLTW